MKKISMSLALMVFSYAVCSTAYASSITVVAPNTNTNGTVRQFGELGETTATTFQVDIAASQLTSLAGDSITALGFRLPSGAASIPGSVTLSGFSLELSGSALPIGSLSTNHAANIGANAAVVYSGTLTLSGLVGGPGPNPFFFINFAILQRTGDGDCCDHPYDLTCSRTRQFDVAGNRRLGFRKLSA